VNRNLGPPPSVTCGWHNTPDRVGIPPVPFRLMATLTITRGLPGSGKTTWARGQRGHVRVNRDDLRRMMHGGPLLMGWSETQVTLAQHAQVAALLRAGVNVICDDTNLRRETVRDLRRLGRECGAEVVIRDFTEVPLEVCIARDATRPPDERVGEETIRGMHRRYLAGRTREWAPEADDGAIAPEGRRSGGERVTATLPDRASAGNPTAPGDSGRAHGGAEGAVP
jgi:predicted kinase